MQRLRSTFKRSRTPTGAEMKSQSSLEVPKQVRSASFDEIQLEVKRQDGVRAREQAAAASQSRQPLTRPRTVAATFDAGDDSNPRPSHQESTVRRLATLRVPQLRSNQRSKSFDACGIDKRGTGNPAPPIPFQGSGCYHCACVEEYERRRAVSGQENEETLRPLRQEQTDDEEEADDEEDDEPDVDAEEDEDVGIGASPRSQQCSPDIGDRELSPEIRVTLTSTDPCYPTTRRRSVASPKLSRQEALTSFPADLSSTSGSREDDDDVDGSSDPSAGDTEAEERSGLMKPGRLVVRDIFLTVPELKRDRAASVDSSFNGNKTADKSGPSQQGLLAVPQQSLRSKSVDIVLPTDAQTRYTALLPSNESRALRG